MQSLWCISMSLTRFFCERLPQTRLIAIGWDSTGISAQHSI